MRQELSQSELGDTQVWSPDGAHPGRCLLPCSIPAFFLHAVTSQKRLSGHGTSHSSPSLMQSLQLRPCTHAVARRPGQGILVTGSHLHHSSCWRLLPGPAPSHQVSATEQSGCWCSGPLAQPRCSTTWEGRKTSTLDPKSSLWQVTE